MITSQDIFNISEKEFNNYTFEIFHHQFENNPVYRSFCDLLLKHPSDINDINNIPFLPIQFFKSHDVICKNLEVERIFYSSGTTNTGRSKHLIANLQVYENSFVSGFERFYGKIDELTILGLLPSYLQQGDSSLIYMVADLIDRSHKAKSGFYLENLEELSQTILSLEEQGEKFLVIGVSYALLDLIDYHKFNLKYGVIMETGGMKGRRKELIRQDLHERLKEGFGVKAIHSEYGMTELLGQAYSAGNGIFECPPWMKVLTRSVQDPLEILNTDKTGGINIIDLANINSCSFIATQDLGKLSENGNFEIIGRFDSADIRGCNLMVL